MVKNKKIFGTFFREKPAMMLIALKNSSSEIYASSLAKTVDCTYSHVVKILQEMERYNIVAFEKQGRLKIIRLTEKGLKVANSIEDIRLTL
ncbi:MAG: winged helix DNA-binding protein [Candidatus Woesearchaeota archaeon]